MVGFATKFLTGPPRIAVVFKSRLESGANDGNMLLLYSSGRCFAAGAFVLFAPVLAASADTIGWWRMDDAGASGGAPIATTASEVNSPTLDGAGFGNASYGTDVPGAFIFDPMAGDYRANQFSLDASTNNAQVRIANNALLDPAAPNASFTIEMFIKLVGEPGSYDSFVSRVQNGPTNDTTTVSDRRGWQLDFDHGTGTNAYGEIRSRWDTPGDPPLDFNRVVSGRPLFVDTAGGTGNPADYTNADPFLEGDGTNDLSSLLWHHIALTFNASNQVLTIWTDYSQGSSQTLVDTYQHPAASLIFGKLSNAGYGLFFDEVRYSSGVLGPDQFLVATGIPEPSGLGVIMAGLAACVFLRFRRRP